MVSGRGEGFGNVKVAVVAGQEGKSTELQMCA